MVGVMSFSRLRKSRLTMMLLATAWLPYMMVCCVVAPFEDSTGAKPNCHVLANVSPVSTQPGTHSDHSTGHSAHHAAASHASGSEQSHPHGSAPGQSCCDLTGKFSVTIEKGVEFTAQPILVVAAYVLPERDFREDSPPSQVLVELHEHSPPIYLKNASFLI